MTRLSMEIWVGQTNIERFHSLLRDANDAGRHRLLAELLAQEEAKLLELARVQECRRRLVQLGADHAARNIVEALLDDAIAIAGAAAGNIQAVDPFSDQLRLVASRGFSQSFLDFFAVVHGDSNSTCGQAMLSGGRILVQDIERSALYIGKESGRVMREAGTVTVQSVPLFGRDRHLLGMLSTHWRSVTSPSPDQQKRLDLRIGRALADLGAF